MSATKGTVKISGLKSTLISHQYQETYAPGLYPEQPTVCSCGFSPPSEPDSDFEWWIDHLVLELQGHEHNLEPLSRKWLKCLDCGDCKKVTQ